MLPPSSSFPPLSPPFPSLSLFTLPSLSFPLSHTSLPSSLFLHSSHLYPSPPIPPLPSSPLPCIPLPTSPSHPDPTSLLPSPPRPTLPCLSLSFLIRVLFIALLLPTSPLLPTFLFLSSSLPFLTHHLSPPFPIPSFFPRSFPFTPPPPSLPLPFRFLP